MNGFRKTLALALFGIPALLPASETTALHVLAKSAVILDAKTGKVIWSRDADTPRFPASTTKIMTGLLLLERTLPTDIIVAPPDVEKVGEASMHLKPGERVTSQDMLYAIMLRSANDGCYAIAKHLAGSPEAFAEMMNQRAREIGCKNTTFHNPNGLNDPLHKISAYDLALIGREAMKYPAFEQVVRTTRYEISRSINTKDTRMVSHNKWLFKDSTADGIKTGYTRPAGHCFVGSATRNGFRIITVVMDSDKWQDDHRQMLDWAFEKYDRQPLVSPQAPISNVAVEGGNAPTLSLGLTAPLDTLLRKTTIARSGSHNVVQPEFSAPVKAPITKGQVVGKARVRDAEGFEQSVDLVALEDVSVAAAPGIAGSAGLPGGFFAVGGTTLILGAAMARSRNLRRANARRTFTRFI